MDVPFFVTRELDLMRIPSSFAIFVFAGLLTIAGSIAPAAAKEIIKDEGGRVIYIIDDDGMVSMFENSSTDITLSVKRGMREKMYPTLEEITPARVPAGASSTLKLRGQNLVGAKISVGVPQIEVGLYLSHPQVVEVPIRIPAGVGPGDVAITVTTPLGSTVSSFKVTGDTVQGLSSRSQNGKITVTTEAPASCPQGMVGIAAERGGFCIEIDRTFSGDLRAADKTCAIAGKRLCDASEWHQACEQSQKGQPGLKNMIGDWEWTSSIGTTRPLTSVLVGQADCTAERNYQPWKTEVISGRCCK
jgi:hypothetical protein